jgi:hypothetical protein
MAENKEDETIRMPKHVNIRLSMKEYAKLLVMAEVATKLLEDKHAKDAYKDCIGDGDVKFDSFMKIIAKLPSKENTIEKYQNRKPRAPTKLYFTDPEESNKNVAAMYKATKKYLEGDKLRHDQINQTCPTDVRIMFYTYIKGKGLVSDKDKTITIDKFLQKIAPNILTNVDEVERRDSSMVWKICNDIRGKTKKSKK